MKTNIIAYVGWLLLFVAFSFYAYGIIEAIRLSWGSEDIKGKYNEVLATTVSSIQTLLLANLGMLLGISVAAPQSTVAKHMMLNRTAPTQVATNPLNIREKIQLAGLVIFIFSLIGCLVTWIGDQFSSESNQVVSVVSASGKMFIGVTLAYLTAALR